MNRFPSYEDTITIRPNKVLHDCDLPEPRFPNIPDSIFTYADKGTLWRCHCRQWWVVKGWPTTYYWVRVRMLTPSWLKVKLYERNLR